MLRACIARCLVLVSLLAACGAKHEVSRYDGKWWASLQRQDKIGFVSGYLDCYIWAASGKKYSDSSIEEQVTAVDHFYAIKPKQQRISVPDILSSLGERHEGRPTGEPHGTYDGDYWRQSDARLSFISG